MCVCVRIHFAFPHIKLVWIRAVCGGSEAQIQKWLALGFDEKTMNAKGSVGRSPVHLVPQAISSQLWIPSSSPEAVKDDQRGQFRQSPNKLTLDEAGTRHLQGLKELHSGAEGGRMKNKEQRGE